MKYINSYFGHFIIGGAVVALARFAASAALFYMLPHYPEGGMLILADLPSILAWDIACKFHIIHNSCISSPLDGEFLVIGEVVWFIIGGTGSALLSWLLKRAAAKLDDAYLAPKAINENAPPIHIIKAE